MMMDELQGVSGRALAFDELQGVSDRVKRNICFYQGRRSYAVSYLLLACYVHTTTKAPDPIRTRKLNVVGLD
jgi:hypothetical protein